MIKLSTIILILKVLISFARLVKICQRILKLFLLRKVKNFLDGHPKEDLLKKKNLYLFEKDKKRIKKYYGNFILFNSDFFSLRDINEELNEYKNK